MLTDKNGNEIAVVLLCLEKRQKAYAESVAKCSVQVRVANSAAEALKSCVENPPACVIIDMVTGMRIGNNDRGLLTLYNLELNWPVLRGTVKRGEPAMIVSTEPQRSAEFSQAIEELIAGSDSWGERRWPRRFIRIPVKARARLRRKGHDSWIRGTIREMSTGGCSITFYGEAPIGADVEVEIRDIGPQFIINGKIVWSRMWEDSVEPPSVGVEFFKSEVPAELAILLSRFLTE